MLSTYVRLAAAVVAGVLVAIVLSYVALIVVVLATIGIPLGAESRPLTVNQSAMLLTAAVVASAVGARTSARIARQRSRWAVLGVGIILAGTMIVGFSGRNSWPDGWGFAVAAAMAAGCVLGEWIRGRPLSTSAQSRER